MLLLGILLLGATGAFTGLLIAYNTGGGPDYTVTMFNNDLVTLNSLEIFIAGLALALIFCLSLAMCFGGASYRRHRRTARIAERREAARAIAERDALAAGTQPDGLTEETPATASANTTTTETRRRHRPQVFGH
jgi:hypothetical protein